MSLFCLVPIVAALEVSPLFWVVFCAAVTLLLGLDMFVLHKKSSEPSLRASAMWTLFWVSLSLVFNGWVWLRFGGQAASEFLAGYLVEWALSMDNVFVFLVIFSYFRVPLKYQYRVLFWGIFGAILMRLSFILLAAEILERFEWVLYIFGMILLWTGGKMLVSKETDVDPDKNLLMRFARQYLPVAPGVHGDRFFVRLNGKPYVTSLFLVLLVVESTDVVFAIDSIPAIFGLTSSTFIIFTSNVFAIMGLRALYFLLAGVIDLFRFLKYGLAAVLIFIGIKMLVKEYWHPSIVVSLLVIAVLIFGSMLISVLVGRSTKSSQDASEPDDPAVTGDRKDQEVTGTLAATRGAPMVPPDVDDAPSQAPSATGEARKPSD